MTKPITEMMADMQKPTREQLQANIQISHNWATAVQSGTFHGAQALHIATLLNFLQNQNQEAVKAYDAETLTHPEWGAQAPVEANMAGSSK